MTMAERSAHAEDLYKRVRSCTRCALSRTRTCAVPGEGPLDAEIMTDHIGVRPACRAGTCVEDQGEP